MLSKPSNSHGLPNLPHAMCIRHVCMISRVLGPSKTYPWPPREHSHLQASKPFSTCGGWGLDQSHCRRWYLFQEHLGYTKVGRATTGMCQANCQGGRVQEREWALTELTYPYRPLFALVSPSEVLCPKIKGVKKSYRLMRDSSSRPPEHILELMDASRKEEGSRKHGTNISLECLPIGTCDLLLPVSPMSQTRVSSINGLKNDLLMRLKSLKM